MYHSDENMLIADLRDIIPSFVFALVVLNTHGLFALYLVHIFLPECFADIEDINFNVNLIYTFSTINSLQYGTNCLD